MNWKTPFTATHTNHQHVAIYIIGTDGLWVNGGPEHRYVKGPPPLLHRSKTLRLRDTRNDNCGYLICGRFVAILYLFVVDLCLFVAIVHLFVAILSLFVAVLCLFVMIWLTFQQVMSQSLQTEAYRLLQTGCTNTGAYSSSNRVRYCSSLPFYNIHNIHVHTHAHTCSHSLDIPHIPSHQPEKWLESCWPLLLTPLRTLCKPPTSRTGGKSGSFKTDYVTPLIPPPQTLDPLWPLRHLRKLLHDMWTTCCHAPSDLMPGWIRVDCTCMHCKLKFRLYRHRQGYCEGSNNWLC